MKNKLILLLLIGSYTSFGQGNPHFFKFIFENEKGEVLLTEFKGKWEIPGKRFVTNTTIDEFIDIASISHGLEKTSFELKGLFTFHHEVRDKPTMMMYFLVKVSSLSEQPVGSVWLPRELALAKIDYGEMREIVKGIYSEKDALLRGKVLIKYDSVTQRRNGQYWIDWN